MTTDDVDVERDRALVERCLAGEAEAFGDIYTNYHDRLVRHCARRLGDIGAAEDVAQESFLRAWRALDRFDNGRTLYPWLQAIASNACTDVLRRRRPTAPLSELRGMAALDHGRGVEEHVTVAFDAELATGALAQLTDRHRRVLQLREQLDWSVQEIAAHEGLEANAVDTLLWRARVALRRRFRALSEGAAAIIVIGGTRVLGIRNRLLHVAIGADRTWSPALRLRAGLAAVAVLGIGAASTSPVWLPSAPAPASRGGRTVATVTDGVTGARTGIVASVTSAGSARGALQRDPAAADVPSVGPGPTAGAQTTGLSPGGPPATNGVIPPGSGSLDGGSGSGDLPAVTPTPVVPALTATLGSVATGVGGAVQGTTSAVGLTVSGVATTVGGAVAPTVGATVGALPLAPVVSQVIAPVATPLTGSAQPGVAPGATGLIGVLGGLAGH